MTFGTFFLLTPLQTDNGHFSHSLLPGYQRADYVGAAATTVLSTTVCIFDIGAYLARDTTKPPA